MKLEDLTYLTIKEAAEYLRVTERSIMRFRASGRLPALKLSGFTRFKREDVAKLLEPAAPIKGPAAGKSWQHTRVTDDASELPPFVRRVRLC